MNLLIYKSEFAMKQTVEFESEFARDELGFLFAKENREIRYMTSVLRRMKFRDDSVNKMEAVGNLIDWEMEQILLESQFTADEFYETMENECPDPRTRPFIGCYCHFDKRYRKVYIRWYKPRPFHHPVTGKQLVYGREINKGSNYYYNSRPFKKFPVWVRETVAYLEERNARKRKRIEVLQKLRTLIRQYLHIIEQEYY